MRLKNVLVVYMKDPHAEHNAALGLIPKVLRKYNIPYQMMQRERVERRHLKGKDLIITLGGDGTFLFVAQMVQDKTPLLGINSNPKKKEGFFLHATAASFEEKLKMILSGRFLLLKATRVQAILNRKKVLPPALNEYFIGTRFSYKVSHYEMELKGKREYQKSSGVIVSTGAGSHCWVRSSGGQVFSIDAQKFQVHVREPYFGSLHKPKLINQLLPKGKSVTLHSLMQHGVIVGDSLGEEYPFPKGSSVRIGMSKNPVSIMIFEKKAWKGLKSGKRL